MKKISTTNLKNLPPIPHHRLLHTPRLRNHPRIQHQNIPPAHLPRHLPHPPLIRHISRVNVDLHIFKLALDLLPTFFQRLERPADEHDAGGSRIRKRAREGGAKTAAAAGDDDGFVGEGEGGEGGGDGGVGGVVPGWGEGGEGGFHVLDCLDIYDEEKRNGKGLKSGIGLERYVREGVGNHIFHFFD